jgi:PAS domain S-box-containing protein
MDETVSREKESHQVSRSNESESVAALLVTADVGLIAAVKGAMEARGPELVVREPNLPVGEILFQTLVGVVLADLDSPELDCRKLIRALHDADDSIPVVVLTDAENRDKARFALEAGAYDLVLKPLDAQIFLFAVRRAIEYRDFVRLEKDHKRIVEEEVHEKTFQIMRREAFLQGILDSTTRVSVVLTDLDQTVRFWNKGAETIFGYSAEEMIGSKITRLYPPDAVSAEVVEKLRAMVKAKTGTVHGQMRQLAKDGRELTILLALSPMVDKSGEVQGILGVGQDVTEEARLTEELRRSYEQLKRTQDASIFSLAKLAESRDEETGLHLTRIQEYCRTLCIGLARRQPRGDVFTEEFIADLVRSSVLHDIGKVGIPDRILLCPGRFGPEEVAIMQQHPIFGGRALEEAVHRLGEKSFLSVGSEVAYYHHERWDGSGYPFRLKEEEIPLAARIVAIADVYDALTTERRYKRAFSHKEAYDIIVQGKGTQFDPELVEVFQELEAVFSAIRDRCSGQ